MGRKRVSERELLDRYALVGGPDGLDPERIKASFA